MKGGVGFENKKRVVIYTHDPDLICPPLATHLSPHSGPLCNGQKSKKLSFSRNIQFYTFFESRDHADSKSI